MPYRIRNPYHEALISTGVASQETGIPQPTITSWCRTGRLHHWVTTGGHYRVRLAEVLAYITTHYDWEEDESEDKNDD